MKRSSLFTLPLASFLFLAPVSVAFAEDAAPAAAKVEKRDADAILADQTASISFSRHRREKSLRCRENLPVGHRPGRRSPPGRSEVQPRRDAQ